MLPNKKKVLFFPERKEFRLPGTGEKGQDLGTEKLPLLPRRLKREEGKGKELFTQGKSELFRAKAAHFTIQRKEDEDERFSFVKKAKVEPVLPHRWKEKRRGLLSFFYGRDLKKARSSAFSIPMTEKKGKGGFLLTAK